MMNKEQESTATKTKTKTHHVLIEKGDDGCTADPDSFHVDGGDAVEFENATGGRIVLVFVKDGAKNDPFKEAAPSGGARPVAANGKEKYTVRDNADIGSYTIKITGQGCEKPADGDASEDKNQVGVSVAMAARTVTDPEMIVD